MDIVNLLLMPEINKKFKGSQVVKIENRFSGKTNMPLSQNV